MRNRIRFYGEPSRRCDVITRKIGPLARFFHPPQKNLGRGSISVPSVFHEFRPLLCQAMSVFLLNDQRAYQTIPWFMLRSCFLIEGSGVIMISGEWLSDLCHLEFAAAISSVFFKMRVFNATDVGSAHGLKLHAMLPNKKSRSVRLIP